MEIIIPGHERHFRHQVDELCKDSEWWGGEVDSFLCDNLKITREK